MSVNVYLNEKVRELPGFKILGPGKDKVMKLTSEACEHTVFDNGEGLHFMWNLDKPIPEDLRELVEEISCHEFIPNMAPRESGIYRHKTAECEIVLAETNPKQGSKYFLKIKKAKNLEDIQELLHLIKTGKIRPDESFEAPQLGKSRAQLETELTATQKELGEMSSRATKLALEIFELQEKVKALCQLASDFLPFGSYDLFFWPFCRKTSVARMIYDILADAPTTNDLNDGASDNR